MPDRLRRKRYGSDLSDREWATIEPLLPKVVYKGWGQPGRWHLRDIVDGIFYVLKTGTPWRELPGDLPHWNSVWGYFYRWRKEGTWQRLHDALRGDLREAAGREREPSAAILDSQSVKGTELTGVLASPTDKETRAETALATAILNSTSTEVSDVPLSELAGAILGPGHGLSEDELPARLAESLVNPVEGAPEGVTCPPKDAIEASGYDAGKKVKGRKRHLLVDTLGLVVAIVVHAGNIQDRDGAKFVLNRVRDPVDAKPPGRLKKIWADSGYAGKLIDWVRLHCGWDLEIVRRPEEAKGFKLVKWRWIVERTFGWLNRFRRLAKDYERSAHTQETMVLLAMTRLMVRRLAHPHRASFRGTQVFAEAA